MFWGIAAVGSGSDQWLTICLSFYFYWHFVYLFLCLFCIFLALSFYFWVRTIHWFFWYSVILKLCAFSRYLFVLLFYTFLIFLLLIFHIPPILMICYSFFHSCRGELGPQKATSGFTEGFTKPGTLTCLLVNIFLSEKKKTITWI